MGDDKGGPVLHQVIKGLLDLSFRLSIQSRGGLIQNQDRGIFQQSSGDGQSLSLAPRETHPSFADLGGKALRQGLDKVQGVGSACRIPYLLIGPFWVAVADIIADRVVE